MSFLYKKGYCQRNKRKPEIKTSLINHIQSLNINSYDKIKIHNSHTWKLCK